jgi:hypothetical protein
MDKNIHFTKAMCANHLSMWNTSYLVLWASHNGIHVLVTYTRASLIYQYIIIIISYLFGEININKLSSHHVKNKSTNNIMACKH